MTSNIVGYLPLIAVVNFIYYAYSNYAFCCRVMLCM